MSLQQLEERSRQQKADYVDITNPDQTISAASTINNEEILQRAAKFMQGKSKVVGIDVDDIKDEDWVAESLYSEAHVLAPEFNARRFWCSADRKFEDTSLGGNYVCNPRPGYTPYADPPKPGILPNRNTLSPLALMNNVGMGHYYSEAHDDSYQVVDFRFGKPEYNTTLGYLLGGYSARDALLANTGRYSPTLYKLGQGLGTAGLFILLGPMPAVAIIAGTYVGGWIRDIVSTNPHKFWYIRPTMLLFWKAASNILNQIMSFKGLYTGHDIDQKTGEKKQESMETLRELQQMMPGVFDDNGAINLRHVINRAERINQQLLKRGAEFASEVNSFEELRDKLQQLASETTMHPPGYSEEEMTEMYINGTNAGIEDGKESSINTLMSGTIEERYANINDPQTQQEISQSAYRKDTSMWQGIIDRVRKYKTYLDAEFSDGSAFASFRVDHTGPVSESFSHSTMKHDIAEKFNQFSAQGRAAYFSFAGGNLGVGQDIQEGLKSIVAGTMSALKIDGLLALMGSAYSDIPETWENAAYSAPSMNYTFRLVSPYGHPIAQMQHLYIPLSIVLAGVLPHAAGLSAYTHPFFCEVYDRGRSITRNGIIEKVIITRGVSNLGFTKTKDALAIDVQLTVRDLSSMIYMPLNMGGLDPRDTIHTLDSTFSDYMASLGSATLGQNVYKGQKLKYRTRAYTRGTVSQITTVDYWASYVRELPIVNYLDLIYPDSGRGG